MKPEQLKEVERKLTVVSNDTLKQFFTLVLREMQKRGSSLKSISDSALWQAIKNHHGNLKGL